ncbi:MAG: DNA translocase FtsK 4TM domain-containing protein, partial [Verrucomicrobiota bacterium]
MPSLESIAVLVLVGIGLTLFLSLVSYNQHDLPSGLRISPSSVPNDPPHNFMGIVGAMVAGYAYFFFGAASFLLPAAFIWFGVAHFTTGMSVTRLSIIGLAVFLLSGATIAHLQSFFFTEWATTFNIPGSGGAIGSFLGKFLQKLVGTFGAFLFLFLVYGLSLILVSGVHPFQFPGLCQTVYQQKVEQRNKDLWERADESERIEIQQRLLDKEEEDLKKGLKKKKATRPKKKAAKAKPGPKNKVVEEEPVLVIPGSGPPQEEEPDDETVAAGEEPAKAEPESVPETPRPKIIDGSAPKRTSAAQLKEIRDAHPTIPGEAYPDYNLPPLELLNPLKEEGHHPADEAGLLATQATIVDTLESFGVSVSPGDITKGPTITRYELYPAKGLRVNRIVSLEANIAMATKAEKINIIAPIPGRDTVGIEIANKDKVLVPLRELIDDPAFLQGKNKLPLALGKDVYGNTILGDLAQMPHLLVAGATGSGKSVCINSIIASLLFRFTPDQLRFIMIDPKVVEMQIYNQLPHMVIPVVTDPKKVILALRWVIKEMERRYQIFAKTGKRNFDSFNKAQRAEVKRRETTRKGAKKIDIDDEGDNPADVPVAKAEGASDDLLTSPEGAAGLANENQNPADATAETEQSEKGERQLELIKNKEEELEIPDSLPYIVVIIDELADL